MTLSVLHVNLISVGVRATRLVPAESLSKLNNICSGHEINHRHARSGGAHRKAHGRVACAELVSGMGGDWFFQLRQTCHDDLGYCARFYEAGRGQDDRRLHDPNQPIPNPLELSPQLPAYQATLFEIKQQYEQHFDPGSFKSDYETTNVFAHFTYPCRRGHGGHMQPDVGQWTLYWNPLIVSQAQGHSDVYTRCAPDPFATRSFRIQRLLARKFFGWFSIYLSDGLCGCDGEEEFEPIEGADPYDTSDYDDWSLSAEGQAFEREMLRDALRDNPDIRKYYRGQFPEFDNCSEGEEDEDYDDGYDWW